MASLLDRLSAPLRGGLDVQSPGGIALATAAVAIPCALAWLMGRRKQSSDRPVAVIAAIGTATPEHAGTNEQFREVVSAQIWSFVSLCIPAQMGVGVTRLPIWCY